MDDGKTPLAELEALVGQIKAQQAKIEAAKGLPTVAGDHAEYMIKKLNEPCVFDFGSRLGGWPESIKHNAGVGMHALKLDLIAKACAERDRIILDASLEINALAGKINAMAPELARALIVEIPAANEG